MDHNKKEKAILLTIVILTLIIISFLTFAEETLIVDLNTVIEKIIENDLDYKITTANYEKARLEHEKRKANYLLQQSRYNELEMESSINSAENTYKNAKEQLINSIISEYTDLYLAALDLEIKNINFELAETRLQEAEAQYQIGDIGSIALLDQENSFKDIQFSLQTASDEFQQKMKEFAGKLALNGKKIELVELSYSNEWQVKEEEVIAAILENSFQLYSRGVQLSLAEIDLERAELTAAELDRKIKEKSLEIARLELEKTRDELKESARQSYYQYKQAVKKVDLNRERMRSAEEKYRLREEQYSLGLITKVEVLEYKVSMLQAKYNYLSAVANYYLTERTLKWEMGLETEVLLDENTDK